MHGEKTTKMATTVDQLNKQNAHYFRLTSKKELGSVCLGAVATGLLELTCVTSARSMNPLQCVSSLSSYQRSYKGKPGTDRYLNAWSPYCT